MLSPKALVVMAIAVTTPVTAVGQRVHTLVRDADIAGLERLLSCDADLVRATDSTGATPLHIAAALGRADAARLLLANGADPDAADDSGLTPLHFAAGALHGDIVDMLLSAGADPMARPALDWPSPVDLAFVAEAYRGGTAVTTMLLDAGASLLGDGHTAILIPRALVAELGGNEEMLALLKEQAPTASASAR